MRYTAMVNNSRRVITSSLNHRSSNSKLEFRYQNGMAWLDNDVACANASGYEGGLGILER